MIGLIMCKLVDGENFSIMGKHHHTKHKSGYLFHRIHVAMSEQDIVINWGFNNFNVDEDGFSHKFYGEILEEPFRG
jgi:hypothetical protein